MKKIEEVGNEFIQENCEELFTKEPSILDRFYIVNNEEYILP